MQWRDWTQVQLGTALGCHQTFAGRLLSGERHVGLRHAFALERLTSEPREDGATFPGGPIRAADWTEGSASPAPGGVAA